MSDSGRDSRAAVAESTEVTIDVSSMPRLSRAPDSGVAPGAHEHQHPSMEEVSARTYKWNPDLYTAQTALVAYLNTSTCLPKRDREILILRSAWNCGCDYQWGMHTEIALESGLTQEEIDRIGAATTGSGWAPHEEGLLRAADELQLTCRMSDATWAILATHYRERQLIELLVLTGFYRMLAHVMNSVGIRPPAGESPDLPGNSFLFAGADGAD